MTLVNKLGPWRNHDGFRTRVWPFGGVLSPFEPLIMIVEYTDTIPWLDNRLKVYVTHFMPPKKQEFLCESWLEVECILMNHTLAGKWLRFKETIRGKVRRWLVAAPR